MEKIKGILPRALALLTALTVIGVIMWQFVYNIMCVVEMGGHYQSMSWISLTVLSLIPGIVLACHNCWRIAKPTATTNWFFRVIAILYLIVGVVILVLYLTAAINWWGKMQNEKQHIDSFRDAIYWWIYYYIDLVFVPSIVAALMYFMIPVPVNLAEKEKATVESLMRSPINVTADTVRESEIGQSSTMF